MLVIKESDLPLFVAVLRKTGADIVFRTREEVGLRPVFQGTYMGNLLWGYVEGALIEVKASNEEVVSSLQQIWINAVQALAQENENGSDSNSPSEARFGSNSSDRAGSSDRS